MRSAVAAALVFVAGAQALAFALPDRRFVPWVGGAAAAAVLLAVRWYVLREPAASADTSRARDPAESLQRWLARTEILVSWADASRADWDKHLRPMLARQFELATGQRKSKDRAAFHATARMVFGDDLWVWVDPDNVAETGRTEPGPGRAVLDELLQRLERM